MKRQQMLSNSSGMAKQMTTETVSKFVPSAAMKESKADNSNRSATQKTALNSKLPKSPLSKTFLSKSHENLSSHQRKKKLSMYADRPKSSLGLTLDELFPKKSSSNKENVQHPTKQGLLKQKPMKASTPIRKATSTQDIDKTGGVPVVFKAPSSQNSAMKRVSSMHNVSKDNQTRKRTSAPADVMAYNAELLAKFEEEKKILEARISEQIQIAEGRKADIEKYKYEIKRLKEQLPSDNLKEEISFLRNENKDLKEKLVELGYPVDQHITDSEKLSQLMKSYVLTNSSSNNIDTTCEAQMRTSASCDSLSTDGARGQAMCMASSLQGMKRASSVTVSEPGMCLGDVCGTPEHPSMLSEYGGNWDKGSNKSLDALSEISVACLTERILQMEETHYSTNEELQATLQELGDLQDAVNQLQEENERLADERSVLLESLCAQTEKLEHCRTQIEQLKRLLISGDLPNKSERDQHLLELLKGAQDEREEFFRKELEYANALHRAEVDSRESIKSIDNFRDKIQLLEDKLSTMKSERESLEKQVSELREQLDKEQVEVNHFKTLLENEKSKVQELEHYCKAAEKSDVEELLHNTRQEKDKLEEKLANTQEVLAHSQNEISRLRESLQSREEEIRVSKNNAKSQMSDMEYRIELAEKERYDAQKVVDHHREHIEQLEQDCDRYLEEKRELACRISELQEEVKASAQFKQALEKELLELRGRYEEDTEEWTQFQKDLQVAVVIANNLRIETEEEMEKIKTEYILLEEKCIKYESEIEKLKIELDGLKIQERASTFNAPKSSILSSAELKGKVLSSVDKELVQLHEGRHNKTQPLSVKSLIRSIEEQVKSGCSSIHSSSCSGSRRNSDSADGGLREFHELMKSPSSPVLESQSLCSPDAPLKSVLKKPAEKPSPLQRLSLSSVSYEGPTSPETPKSAPPLRNESSSSLSSILSSRTPSRRSSGISIETPGDRKETAAKDPLAELAKKMKGSKRNALLKWCQQKTVSYHGVDITNFSSSWNDGLAFCALLHSYLPDKIPFAELNSDDKAKKKLCCCIHCS
ncbi:hypothetical protein ACJMK2_012320 [Sinanodonta woodiana]|uniref:Calponin-homology (CH) domain-containing protein n=1 Tax=Sinanodonta woodiana TaxID=1069815 RepID=A0ABD3VA41_SINWO